MIEGYRAVQNSIYEHAIHPVNIAFYQQLQSEIEAHISTEQMTLPQAAIQVYKDRNAHIDVLFENETTQWVLDNGAGVLVGNNPHPGANFILFNALATRKKDNYYFFDKSAAKPYWAESAQQHILPTYFDTKQLENAQGFLGQKMKSSPALSQLQTLSPEQRLHLNNETLSLAINRIKEGGIVGIFPSGGGDHTKNWKRGIGSIAQQLIQSKTPSYFIMAFIEGSTPYDKYRLGPVINTVNPINIKLHISAISLKDALYQNKPNNLDIATGNQKHIAAQIKGRYLYWVEGLRGK